MSRPAPSRPDLLRGVTDDDDADQLIATLTHNAERAAAHDEFVVDAFLAEEEGRVNMA